MPTCASITVTGGQKYQRLYAESIVSYCVNRLLPRLAPKIEVNIVLSRKLEEETGNLGSCIWNDSNDRPRSFTIEADCSMSLRSLLITLAHETVHLKQFARNEQKQTFASRERRWNSTWQGTRVDTDKTDYWELPWEIEAHGRETGLFVNWGTEYGHIHKAWAQDKNMI